MTKRDLGLVLLFLLLVPALGGGEGDAGVAAGGQLVGGEGAEAQCQGLRPLEQAGGSPRCRGRQLLLLQHLHPGWSDPLDLTFGNFFGLEWNI